MGRETRACYRRCLNLRKHRSCGKDLTRIEMWEGSSKDFRLTGTATDSRWPLSMTRPVIRPTASSDKRWLEAKEIDGTYNKKLARENQKSIANNAPDSRTISLRSSLLYIVVVEGALPVSLYEL